MDSQLSTSPPTNSSTSKQPVKSILKNKTTPSPQRIEKEKKTSAA